MRLYQITYFLGCLVFLFSFTARPAKSDEVCVQDTWGDFVVQDGITDLAWDYLVIYCNEPLAIILTIDDRQVVYRWRSRGQEIKHYRRNTNNASYVWCRDQDYEEGTGCPQSDFGEDVPLGSAAPTN